MPVLRLPATSSDIGTFGALRSLVGKTKGYA